MVPRASPSSLISPPPPPLPPPTPAEDAAEAGELAAGGIGTLNVAPRSRSLRGGACTVCAGGTGGGGAPSAVMSTAS